MGATYHDIPRGPIKDNLMRKLACKTLMDILPADVGTRVQQEIKENKLSVGLRHGGGARGGLSGGVGSCSVIVSCYCECGVNGVPRVISHISQFLQCVQCLLLYNK